MSNVSYLSLANMSKLSYRSASVLSTASSEVDQDFKCVLLQHEISYYGNEMGFAGQLWVNEQTDQAVISFRGTTIYDLSDIFADAAMVMGGSTYQGSMAQSFVSSCIDFLQTTYENTMHLTFTGHSLGGWLADLASKNFSGDHNAVVFNAPRTGASSGGPTEYVFSDPMEWGLDGFAIHDWTTVPQDEEFFFVIGAGGHSVGTLEAALTTPGNPLSIEEYLGVYAARLVAGEVEPTTFVDVLNTAIVNFGVEHVDYFKSVMAEQFANYEIPDMTHFYQGTFLNEVLRMPSIPESYLISEIYGQEGADTLIAGNGAFFFNGGQPLVEGEIDRVDYSQAQFRYSSATYSDGIVVEAYNPAIHGSLSQYPFDHLVKKVSQNVYGVMQQVDYLLDVEEIIATEHRDIIYFNGSSLQALGGNDTIYTGTDVAQTIDAGAGDDTIHIGINEFASHIEGGDGFDSIVLADQFVFVHMSDNSISMNDDNGRASHREVHGVEYIVLGYGDDVIDFHGIGLGGVGYIEYDLGSGNNTVRTTVDGATYGASRSITDLSSISFENGGAVTLGGGYAENDDGLRSYFYGFDIIKGSHVNDTFLDQYAKEFHGLGGDDVFDFARPNVDLAIYGGDGSDLLRGAGSMYGGEGADVFFYEYSMLKIMDYEPDDVIFVNRAKIELTSDGNGGTVVLAVSGPWNSKNEIYRVSDIPPDDVTVLTGTWADARAYWDDLIA